MATVKDEDGSEPFLGGALVEITASNNVTQTVTTDSDGFYTVEVPPGQALIEVKRCRPIRTEPW